MINPDEENQIEELEFDIDENAPAAVVNEILRDATLYYDATTSRGVTVNELLHKKRKDRSGLTSKKKDTGNLGVLIPFKPKDQWNTDSAVELLRRHHIKILSGAAMLMKPSLLNAKDTEGCENTQLSEDKPKDQVKVQFLFPNFDNIRVLPTYNPSYSTVNYDADLYNVGLLITIEPEIPNHIREAVKESLRRIQSVAQTSAFGGGSMAGQIGRLAKVLEVRKKVKKLLQTSGHVNLDFESWKRIQDSRNPMPFSDAGKDEVGGVGLIDLIHSPSEICTNLEEISPDGAEAFPGGLIRVESESDAGILWSAGTAAVKRRQVIGQDLDLADYMWMAASGMSKQIGVKKKRTSMKVEDLDKKGEELFWESWNWCRLTKLKNKAEVYSRDEWEVKTRNIMVTTSAAFLMANVILSAHSSYITVLDSPTSYSLQGFSPFHGGMDRMVKLILSRGLGFTAVYADNLFVVARKEGRLVFVSLDGDKFESAIEISHVAFEYARCLGQFNSVDNGWWNYGTLVAPRFTMDQVGVWGASQIPLPFMGSGSQGTAYHNQNKMTLVAHYWREKNPVVSFEGDEPLGLREACVKAGAVLKVERVTDLELFSESENMNEVAIDLLGYSFVNLKALGLPEKFIAVLERKRLYDSITFLKMEKSSRNFPMAIEMAIKLFRLRCFYFLGAWIDPGLAEMIHIACYRIIKSDFSMAGVDWDQQLEELTHSLSITFLDDRKELVAILANRSIPLLYDVIKFHLDEESADTFALWVVENSNSPWSFLPLEVYEAIYELRGETPIPVPKGIVTVQASPTGLKKEVIVPWSTGWHEQVVARAHEPVSDWAESIPPPKPLRTMNENVPHQLDELPEVKVPKVTRPEVREPTTNPFQGALQAWWIKKIPAKTRAGMTSAMSAVLGARFENFKRFYPDDSDPKERSKLANANAADFASKIQLPIFLFLKFFEQNAMEPLPPGQEGPLRRVALTLLAIEVKESPTYWQIMNEIYQYEHGRDIGGQWVPSKIDSPEYIKQSAIWEAERKNQQAAKMAKAQAKQVKKQEKEARKAKKAAKKLRQAQKKREKRESRGKKDSDRPP